MNRGLKPLPADFLRPIWWYSDGELAAIAGVDLPDLSALSDAELEWLAASTPACGGARPADSEPRTIDPEPGA